MLETSRYRGENHDQNRQKKLIASDNLHPIHDYEADKGRVVVLETSPTKVARLKMAEQFGFENKSVAEVEQAMRDTRDELEWIHEEYGIDSVYRSHRIDQLTDDNGSKQVAIVTVADKVEGESVLTADMTNDEKQAAVDSVMMYYGDRLFEKGPLFRDLKPEQVFWGHTAENEGNRLIIVDPDPYLDRDKSVKAFSIQARISEHKDIHNTKDRHVSDWAKFCHDNNLDTSSIEFVFSQADKANSSLEADPFLIAISKFQK